MKLMGMPTVARTSVLVKKVAAIEHHLCAGANHLCQQWLLRRMFGLVSRLGDGWFWYALMAWIPFGLGMEYLHVSVRMALAGLIGVLVYTLLKRKTARLRPYLSVQGVTLLGHPLDHYSFPSGHTLHAVSFTIIVVVFMPQFATVLVPFALLVALSRVFLGLHYPTDVLAGALIGAVLGSLAIRIS